jgi:hypothetical protein
MEVVVPKPASGQTVYIGCLDRGPIASEVGKTSIIEQDDHDIRAVVHRSFGFRPPWSGFGNGASDNALERFAFAHFFLL